MAAQVVRMNKMSRVLVLLYLMTMSSASLYGTYSVWAAVPDAPVGVPAEPVLDDSEAPADGSPLIVDLDPREFVIGSRRPSVRVIGHNFTGSSGVLVDGTPREAELVGPNELLVRLAASDFVASGPMMLTVSNPAPAAEDGSPAGTAVSNAAALIVSPAGTLIGEWSMFGTKLTPLSADLRLVLLVLFTGTFGATIAGLQSLGDYRGKDKLLAKWTIFYIVRPFIGAGIAFMIYLVIRGGLLAGTDVDFTATTPIGIIAVSALAGMFSDKAFVKLDQVARNLFGLGPSDTRGDTLESLSIDAQAIAAEAGKPFEQQLTATGGTSPYTWTIRPALPPDLTLGDKGLVSGTPQTAASQTHTVAVTDAKGTVVEAEIDVEVT